MVFDFWFWELWKLREADVYALKNIRKYIDMVLNKQQLSAPGGKTPEKESVLKKLEEAKATQTTKKTETKNLWNS